jgi:hypothetical protein
MKIVEPSLPFAYLTHAASAEAGKTPVARLEKTPCFPRAAAIINRGESLAPSKPLFSRRTLDSGFDILESPMPSQTALLLLGLLPFVANAQTADEIIAKNIQARGGLAKLKSLQSLRVSGNLAVGGFRAAFVQENKRPFKVREEQIVQGMVGIDAYDGKIAWHVVPWEGRKDPDLISADDRKGLIEDADIEGQLVDYRNKDHRVEYVGHDSVEGTDCYKLKLTLADGDVRYYYIDTDTFLELKIENERTIRGTVRYFETYFGDYEKVDGIYFPFALEAGSKGESERVKYTIDKVIVNPALPDSQFTMPSIGGNK